MHRPPWYRRSRRRLTSRCVGSRPVNALRAYRGGCEPKPEELHRVLPAPASLHNSFLRPSSCAVIDDPTSMEQWSPCFFVAEHRMTTCASSKLIAGRLPSVVFSSSGSTATKTRTQIRRAQLSDGGWNSRNVDAGCSRAIEQLINDVSLTSPRG